MLTMKIQSLHLLLVIAVHCFFSTATEDGDVQIPPSFTQRPNAHIVYPSGSILLIDCKAEGSPDVKYTWTKNGVQLEGHIRDTATQFAKRGATSDDEGVYQCFASNEYGTDVSDKSHVQMEYVKSSLSTRARYNMYNAEQVNVTEGEPLTILAPPFESVPRTECVWIALYKDDRGRCFPQNTVVPTKRIQVDRNGLLHLVYAIPDDELVSNCYQPTFRYNYTTYYGNITNITVTRVGNNSLEAPPRIIHYYDPSVALLGRNVSFRCIFSGYPSPNITWTLPGNSSLSPRHELKFDNTELFIVYINPSDEGNYTCSASNTIGDLRHDFQLRVEAVPSFARKFDRPQNIDAIENSNATFVCNAVAKPDAWIDWFYNGELIDVDKLPTVHRRMVVSENRKNLTITNVARKCSDRKSKTDLMVIQCNASNVHGYVFASGYLNIVEPPACEGATWIILISSTLCGALMLVVGLIVGLRCKELSKYRAFSARDQHEYYKTRATMDSFYETIRDEGGINQHRLSRPMTANTSFTERQTSRPLVAIPGSTQPQRSGEEEHEYYPKEDGRRLSTNGSDDRTTMKAPHYLTISD